MNALDWNAAHGTAGLIRFDIFRDGIGWSMLAHYSAADDNGRPWTATYGPFDESMDAVNCARNLSLPGDDELGDLVQVGDEFRIYAEAR